MDFELQRVPAASEAGYPAAAPIVMTGDVRSCRHPRPKGRDFQQTSTHNVHGQASRPRSRAHSRISSAQRSGSTGRPRLNAAKVSKAGKLGRRLGRPEAAPEKMELARHEQRYLALPRGQGLGTVQKLKREMAPA